MHVRDYIEAINTLLMKGADIEALLEKLTAVLQKKGHSRMYLHILKGLLNKLEQHSAMARAQVVIGRLSDADTLSKTITASLETLGTNGQPLIVVDETVIGGFKTTVGARTIDKTYKKQLLTVYRSLTD